MTRRAVPDAGPAAEVAPVRRHATIRDVSRLAEVSRMTVSRVLSEPSLVSPGTRARVMQAIADLGYVPDRTAGSLSTRRTGFVALMLPTLTNVNFATVAKNLADTLKRRNYHIIISYNDYSLAEEEAQLRNLLARRPEAVVLSGCVHSRGTLALLHRAGIPVIEIADLAAQPFEHAIGFGNYRIGRVAADYLISRGFDRIGALASELGTDHADHRGEERIRGFADRLREEGMSTERIVRVGNAPVSFDQGVLGMTVLLDRHPETEALFCVSDLSAIGAMMECGRRGIAIPDDLSLVGFGDFDIGRVTNPPLTTVRVDFAHIGRATGELIIDLLSGKTVTGAVREDVGLTLEERGSVRPGRPQAVQANGA